MITMKPTDRIKYIAGYEAEFFHVDSSQLEKDVKFILENKLEYLIINGRGSYHISNIDWLSQVHNIVKWVVITPPINTVFSFVGLSSCQDVLKIKINNNTKENIDLSRNINLIELHIENATNFTGLEKLVNLESLVINKPSLPLFNADVFNKLKKLKYLCISDSKLKFNLNFLNGTPLSNLLLYNCKNLSLEGINKSNISKLEINKCKDIEKVELIYLSKKLKELKIIDSINPESAENFATLTKLETLIVLGSSYLIDGNLDKLIKKLKVFNYDNKRHYNIKYEYFKKNYLVK